MEQGPDWWCAMESAVMHEAMAVAGAKFWATRHDRRDQLAVQETGFRWAWSIFQNTHPRLSETPNAYLKRLTIAIRLETGGRGGIRKPDWASFMVGIEWLLLTLRARRLTALGAKQWSAGQCGQ